MKILKAVDNGRSHTFDIHIDEKKMLDTGKPDPRYVLTVDIATAEMAEMLKLAQSKAEDYRARLAVMDGASKQSEAKVLEELSGVDLKAAVKQAKAQSSPPSDMLATATAKDSTAEKPAVAQDNREAPEKSPGTEHPKTSTATPAQKAATDKVVAKDGDSAESKTTAKPSATKATTSKSTKSAATTAKKKSEE